MPPSAHDPWSGLTPRDVSVLLADGPDVWWLCGGWAIDAWADRLTRPHADIDIGCFREDLPSLLEALAGWDYFAALDGVLGALDDGGVAGTVTSLWCRRPQARAWDLQIMIEEREGSSWCFRRNRDIRLAVADLTWRSPQRLRVIRPEVQLLYKAKDVRPQDQADFEVARPKLSRSAQDWLLRALSMLHPGHPWLVELRTA